MVVETGDVWLEVEDVADGEDDCGDVCSSGCGCPVTSLGLEVEDTSKALA